MMNDQHIVYVIMLSIATGLTLLIAAWAWLRQRTPGSLYFALMMVSVAIWAVTGAVEFSLWTPAEKILWSKLSYLGIVGVPPFWWLFAREYSRQARQLPRLSLAWLWLIPLITLIAAATNEWHRLIWLRVTPASDVPGAQLIYEHGLIFWINAVYAYLLLLWGTVLLVRAVLRSSQLYRRQVTALLIGVALPWIGNAVGLFGLSPWPGYDLTPFAFTLSGLALAYGLFRFQMFDIVPVARDALIERMTDSVLVLDARYRLVDLNPAAARLLELSVAAIGQSADAVLSPWIDTDQLNTLSQTEVAWGDERWFDVRVSPLHNWRQQLNGHLIVLRDITARKQAELKLQQYAQELESRNTELDAFAHTVAHDLQSPLAATLGYGTLLETRYAHWDDNKRLDTLRIINRNGHRMSSIIDEMLLLARLRQPGDVQLARLDMDTIVAEVLDRLVMLIQDTCAEIHLPPTWPTAWGYAAWVEEIWANYISNACKYGGNPAQNIPPMIHLGWDDLPADLPNTAAGNTRLIRFWVCDNGPGLGLEEQARLFTPFTRLDQAHHKGHGLGLSIVRRIADRLAGQAGVESEPGHGSVFWFTLPAV